MTKSKMLRFHWPYTRIASGLLEKSLGCRASFVLPSLLPGGRFLSLMGVQTLTSVCLLFFPLFRFNRRRASLAALARSGLLKQTPLTYPEVPRDPGQGPSPRPGLLFYLLRFSFAVCLLFERKEMGRSFIPLSSGVGGLFSCLPFLPL
ncbi:hypothetical protein AVEN_169076-1 [Araneus ventricosus]|uniref:Transmembrane protein n=1 Tax=Araneus ventricosus TaxID=182803 RepID=A0A4Y2S8K6_ARAVE|nr:hypothetical protein AVEN_114881-1 [Araneus ventricosus]GBN83707.1 hypothetical protein AVEN_169076-1 [Araneus ventricosus]